MKFTKMHGAGNDFVVIDGVRQSINLTPEQLRLLADRNFGVGCDQILLVEKALSNEADFRYRIFNADGGEVEQCGNGARCFVRFVHEQKLTSKRAIVVETRSGMIMPRLEDDGHVTVNMGAPIFEAARIPFSGGTGQVRESLEVDGEILHISAVSMGNPHAVQGGRECRDRRGGALGAVDRATSAFSETRQCWLYAGDRQEQHQAARI